MIIQFAVENFRSLKKEQVLSLVRGSGDEMPDNFFETAAPAVPALLKSAAIYGANASGKSNLIRALDSMVSIIRNSFKKEPDEPIKTESFLFDVVSRHEPTLYDISVVVPLKNKEGDLQETRVDYGFVADIKMIYEEWLSVYPEGEEQKWFHREFNDEKKEYIWQIFDYLEGEKESWKNQTREDQLFLSTSVQLNSQQLRPIYNLFLNRMPIFRSDKIGDFMSRRFWTNLDKGKYIFISLFKSAGIEIYDMAFERPNASYEDTPKAVNENSFSLFPEYRQDEIFFIYLDRSGNKQKINLREESDGTQKLFEFAGLILTVLQRGDVLIIDEINKSLHPDLACFIIKLFNSSLNRKNAQLIFTTHETSILRKDLLRRDQIWFCEKEKDRGTTLYSLAKFIDEQEDIEDYYLHGRYGAKPIISDFELPEDFWENK